MASEIERRCGTMRLHGFSVQPREIRDRVTEALTEMQRAILADTGRSNADSAYKEYRVGGCDSRSRGCWVEIGE